MRVKSEAKRQQIIEVAAEAFRELGFEKTSMAEICTRVGGSKATLYNYFSSKDELFFEVMAQSCEAEFDAAYRAIQDLGEDIGEALRNFGQRFLKALYSPEIQATRHLAIASSAHSELGRFLYERGVSKSQAMISSVLQKAMDQGKLRPANSEVAAKHLYALLESEFLDRFLFQRLGALRDQEIRDATDRATQVFLAAYGVYNP